MTFSPRCITINSRPTSYGPVIHRAGWVVVDPWTILPNGFVKVESGLIKETGQGRDYGFGRIIDHGSGVLLSALVNAHTHLELSALKGKIPFEKGFGVWVKELIKQRESLGINALAMGAKEGIKSLIESGCLVAGEISTLGLTREMFFNSELAGVWFREFLENTPNGHRYWLDKNEKIIASLAGHAPHTTSPQLLVELKGAARKHNLPFSIHLAELEAEVRFLKTAKGPWADFLTERGIDFSGWGLPAPSPVKYLERHGILDENTLAVHLIHVDKKDIEILLRHQVQVCLSPRSNQNLHHRLPDMDGMLKAGLKPCLGTDSLASADSLSIFDEMAFTSRAFPLVPPEEILAMATINGAKALGFGDRFGSLAPGKSGAFIYMPVKVSTSSGLLETVVNARFDK
ncbi:MAG: amidohydrolase family protein [Deltaproteobacteria bacterium]|nr:amidohydrolase family protein [Deltaproteobacteria bacterium]